MVELLEGLLAVALEGVDAQVHGGAFRQSPALFGGVFAKGGFEAFSQPFGIIAQHMGGGAVEGAVVQPLALGVSQGCGGVLFAGEEGGDGVRVLPAHQAQGAEHDRAGLAGAHQEGAGGLAAQGVEDQRADGHAILGACEAVGLAPFLQGVGGGAVARLDHLEEFDRGGNAGCGGHRGLAIFLMEERLTREPCAASHRPGPHANEEFQKADA